MAQVISPSLRDIIDGVLWEEDKQPVGIANVMRMGLGNSDSWSIVNVGVLPAYRRRGIARKLVEATIQIAVERGAKRVILDVIDGNDPAYQLYVSLGFVKFDYGVEFNYSHLTRPVECPFPAGYTIKPLARADWRPSYELARRITPPDIQRYLPVEESRYRVGTVERMLAPIFESGIYAKRIGIYAPPGKIVATANYAARMRPGGINSLSITLDPAHNVLAPFLIASLLNEIIRIAPKRNIEMRVMSWSAAVMDAATAAGFEHRMAGNRMGLKLNGPNSV